MLKYPRLFIFGLYASVVSTLGIVYCLFRPVNPENTYVLARLLGGGFKRILGIRVRMINPEYLTQQQPNIIIGNHQSNWDMFLWGSFVPKRTVSVGKKEITYIPIFGLVYWLAGNVILNRQSRAKSTTRMGQAAQQIKDLNISLAMFPEGTRSRGRGLGPFKKGAFFTAIEAQVPLVPVLSSTYTDRLNFNRVHAGEIILKCYPPIQTNGLEVKHLNELTEKTRVFFLQELDKLNNGAYDDL
ncbi:MAG: 1-acylglycerol-3-phosphate O-acyltransferase [Bacteroidetes Order II. Incertae sedis bacterium]|nr:1-acylglycerol-3-phosphate O-acyltransferase [Bacteroidetes Order II. bacterium]